MERVSQAVLGGLARLYRYSSWLVVVDAACGVLTVSVSQVRMRVRVRVRAQEWAHGPRLWQAGNRRDLLGLLEKMKAGQ